MIRTLLRLLPVCLLLSVLTSAHADTAITHVLGATSDSGTCEGGERPSLIFNGSITRTTNDTGMRGFFADYRTGKFAYVTRNTTSQGYLVVGNLNPLTVTTIGPVFPTTPTATEATTTYSVTGQSTSYVSIVGRVTGSGCGGSRCPRWLRYPEDLRFPITQTDYNTSLPIDTQGFAAVGGVAWMMNSNGVDEVLYRIQEGVIGGVSSTVNTGGGAPSANRNTIIAVGTSDIVLSAPAIGRYERWSQGDPPVFNGSTLTSCTTQLMSVLVVPEIDAIFTGCNGRVNRATFTTGVETATQDTGVSGEMSWNGLMYDPNFKRVYLAVVGVNAIVIYRLDPDTLQVLLTHTEVIAGVNTATVVNRAWLDPLRGRIYVGANVATPGSLIASFTYCVTS